MSAQHTPGPWTAITDYYDDGAVIVDANGFKHIETTRTAILHDYEEKLGIPHWADSESASREISLEEETANAHLIASAPELLEALRDVIGWVPKGFWHTDAADQAVQNARAAIAKATGSAA